MGGLFISGKISPFLINSLLEADGLMTVEERDDLALQKSLINRAFNHLSPLEPAKIKLTSKVAMCKTFIEFLLLWTRYKVSQQVIVDDLTADGYIIQPKTYLLTQGSSNPDKGKSDKLPKQQISNNNSDRSVSTFASIKLDPAILACSGCGRQEYDEKQKAVHDANNCYLKHHPDHNNDPLIKWKDSSSGKAFAALNPPWKVLPFSYLKDGHKRDLPSKGNFPSKDNFSCMNCDYLVSLKSNFVSSTSNINFLPVTILSVQAPSKGKVSLKERDIRLQCLLDSGSLAGDFISQEIIEDFSLNSFVKLDTSNKKICSGLDNSCSISLGSLTASVMFINEVNNKSEILTLILKVLKNSPIDLIIGRESIKQYNLVSKNSSHFFSQTPLLLSSITEDLTCTSCSAKEGPVHMCGCQRQTNRSLDLLLNVSPTEIQVVGNTNRIARLYSDPSTIERNMLSRETLASLVAPWGDNPPSEPRVGGVLLGENPPQSLTAATQTHTVYSSFTDVESYKLNDELIYHSLYTPLHEELKVCDVTYFRDLQKNNEMGVIDPTLIPSSLNVSVLSAVFPDIPTKFIDDDKIDQLKNDTFSPWSQPESSVEELLGMIHIEGDASLQQGIRELCKEYGHIFALKLPREASNLTPFNITVDSLAWRVPKNRMPPRKQSSIKQVAIAQQVEDLLEQGIIERSTAEYYSQVVIVPKPDGKDRLCIDFQNLNLVSESHSHPLPNIKQMLNRLGDHRSEILV